ncbi:MAG: hypothetical protein IPJ69_07530 [Deltaproteobacteria bacterium]|nr:MAG: hypothetical protein IPJ69_07530 [Deltaproteobacteria bacterium]
MNFKSVLGFSFLTACSTPAGPMVSVFDSGARETSVVLDAVVDRGVERDVLVEDRFVPPQDSGRDASRDLGMELSDAVDIVDVPMEVAVDVPADVPVATTRAARDLGVSLPCQPTEIDYFSDSGQYLLGLCTGRQFFQVSSPLTTPRVTLRRELAPIPAEELRDIVSTTDLSGVVVGASSVYQIDTDSSGTNVRLTFSAGHFLSGNGVYVAVGTQRKFYAATFYSDATYTDGEILAYDVSTSGALIARRSSLPDGGVTHQHVSVSGRPVGMAVSQASPVSEVVVLTTNRPSLMRINPITDATLFGRMLPADVRPIDQSELPMTVDGRFVVFGNQDGRLVIVDRNVTPSTSSDGVRFISIPGVSQITDVRVSNNRAYVSTATGTVYVISIPEGTLQETITTGSSMITAAEIAGSNIIFSGGGRLYAASL